MPFAFEVKTNVKHPVVLVFDAASVGKIINPVKFPNKGAVVELPSYIARVSSPILNELKNNVTTFPVP